MPVLETTNTHRAAFEVAGYHHWHDLLFLHWPVPAEELQARLPARLTVDTFDGWGWLGIVAFDMSGVRPWWLPALPGVSAFHETNVRTYVRLDDDEPAVWFFSLDAASSLAVRLARWRWHLNYFRSSMGIARGGKRITYTGRRAGPAIAEYEITAELGHPLGPAISGTFDHFLVERYVLYTQRRDGMLMRAAVDHKPYPLRNVDRIVCRQTLTAAMGIPKNAPPERGVYSDGVAVRIGCLRPAG